MKDKFTSFWRDVIQKRLASFWYNTVQDQLATEKVFQENEVEANRLIEKTLFGGACIMLLCWFLNSVGVLAISEEYVYQIFLVGTIALTIPAVVCHIFKGEKKWIKFMLIASVIAVFAYLDSILTFNVSLVIALPVILSCRYYSCQLTVETAVLSTVAFTISAYCGAVFNFNNPDLNFASPDKLEYISNVMLLSFLPRWLAFLLFSAICYGITRCGRKLVLDQDAVSRKNARVETELNMASQIQEQALPTISELPDNRYRNLDLAARMVPAKEVGGDFYDFFYPDPAHLALIIADVADKGIAASLYMMMSKTLLDSRLSISVSPGQVLENVNRQLHEKSPMGMFVTVWLGVLDLKTGDLVTASAGHEYPVVKRKNGEFELVKDKHGFVLGGWKNMKFKENLIHLDEGDVLFVYTDGVPEANSVDGEMFGVERMLDSLNRHKDCGMDELIVSVKEDIDSFASGAPQFDDTTMLALQLQSAKENKGISVDSTMEELAAAQKYVSEILEDDNVSPFHTKKIGMAVDTIFSDIVKTGSASRINVLCEADVNHISVAFRDDGAPSDVSQKEDTASVCKTMDNVEYRYEDGMNVLSIELNMR